MLEYIIFAIALIGTGFAGWQDFKTTGVEDKYAVFIGVSGILISFFNSFITGVWSGFYYSIMSGVAFLIFGYIMYYSSQWGEADVLILGALGFLIPESLSFFAADIAYPYYSLVFLATIFIVGGIYSIIYSGVVAFKTKGFLNDFSRRLHLYSGTFLNFSVIIFIFSVLFLGYIKNNYLLYVDVAVQQLIMISVFYVIGFFLVTFSKTIDSLSFSRRVNVTDLCEGDVLAEKLDSNDDYSKKLSGKLFIGLEKEDIAYIKTVRKQVLIKEGIPFVPAFFFSIIFMWLFGNVFVFMF